MTELPSKIQETISLSAERLLSRASKSRSLPVEIVKERLTAAVIKYLSADASDLDLNSVNEFINGLHADDLCLILACERGDETAWEDLVRLHDQTVRSAARKTAANPEDADDLASSIWAELYGIRQDSEGKRRSKLAYYSGRGSLGGWLRAVVAQLAIDEYRKTSRYVQVEEDRDLEVLANETAASNGHLVSKAADPETALTEKDMRHGLAVSVKKAIEDLENEDRLIIKLYYFDGLKLKNIANTFGYHEATASRKLARIQTDLRKAVEIQLRKDHGWTNSEVTRYLAETAASLGIDVEKMLAAFVFLALLQDFWL